MSRLIKILANIVVIIFALSAFLYIPLNNTSAKIPSDLSFWDVFKFICIYVGGTVVVVKCIINLIILEEQ